MSSRATPAWRRGEEPPLVVGRVNDRKGEPGLGERVKVRKAARPARSSRCSATRRGPPTCRPGWRRRSATPPARRSMAEPFLSLDARERADMLRTLAATVTVLSPARTFWEKATLIQVECHRRRLANRPDRLSRHWFDLTCLAAHDVGWAAPSWPTSSGTRRCSSTPATPTTINASTADCVSFPTTTSSPPCNQTTTPCATPASSATTHRVSTP